MRERWEQVRQELQALQTTDRDLNLTEILDLFDKRYKVQTSYIHDLAYRLTPKNAQAPWRPNEKQKVIQILRELVPSTQADEAEDAFFEFIAKEGKYHHSELCWKPKYSPKQFWLLQKEACEPLAQIALRIFHSVANQAAAERAFSQMNLIQTKLRNRLSNEKANQLLYIRINESVLRRVKTNAVRRRLPPREREAAEQVEMEEQLQEDVAAEDMTAIMIERTAQEEAFLIQNAPNRLPPMLPQQLQWQPQFGLQTVPQQAPQQAQIAPRQQGQMAVGQAGTDGNPPGRGTDWGQI